MFLSAESLWDIVRLSRILANNNQFVQRQFDLAAAKSIMTVIIYDTRPCGASLFGTAANPLCSCCNTISAQRFAGTVVAYMRLSCAECKKCHENVCFTTPCLRITSDCKMICVVGTGAVSVPPPLADFAAALEVPVCIIADVSTEPGRLARWMSGDTPQLYRINLRLAELRRFVATGDIVTLWHEDFADLRQYWPDIRYVDVDDDHVRVDLASAWTSSGSIPDVSDDLNKFAVAVDALDATAKINDYRNLCQVLRDDVMLNYFELSVRERKFVKTVLRADRLTPPRFIALMTPYTFGWMTTAEDGSLKHVWSQTLLWKLDELKYRFKIGTHTLQRLPTDKSWQPLRCNPIIDALLESRRYGLMVLASLMFTSELIVRPEICEYVRDTFREWGRADLVANFDYLLANGTTSCAAILAHHRSPRDRNSYYPGGRVLGHYMFIDVRYTAVMEVATVLKSIKHIVPAVPRDHRCS